MRKAIIKRKTRETDISVKLNLDGAGKSKIKTGIGFLDHMLTLFAKHGLFDLEIKASGDLDVDIHHTNEDVGICLGDTFKKALGNKKRITRYGSEKVPMDEALVESVVDISDRPYLKYNVLKGKVYEDFKPIMFKVRDKNIFYDFNYCEQFLRAFVGSAGFTLHVNIISGEDTHHVIEAIFKSLARALSKAVKIDRRVKGVPSTKGKL